MLELDIPGYGALTLEHLVLDVNGTIAGAGVLLPGVAAHLSAIADTLHPVAITADTQGTAAELGHALGIEVHIIASGWEAGDKLALVEDLGPDSVVAIGNGANDALVLRASALGICVIGPEGASRAALESADIVVGSIDAALGLLVDPRRLIATLRT
jgi:soluble P-type ATPase